MAFDKSNYVISTFYPHEQRRHSYNMSDEIMACGGIDGYMNSQRGKYFELVDKKAEGEGE